MDNLIDRLDRTLDKKCSKPKLHVIFTRIIFRFHPAVNDYKLNTTVPFAKTALSSKK